MENKIKEIRVTLDGLANLCESLKPIRGQSIVIGHIGTHNEFGTIMENSREIQQSVDSLIMSKCWLGKVLKELGTINPYPESKSFIRYKTIQEIYLDINPKVTIPIGTLSKKVLTNTFGKSIVFEGFEEYFLPISEETKHLYEIVINETIEPTADVSGVDNTFGIDGIDSYNYDQLTHIQKLKWLRAEIEKVEIELKNMNVLIENTNQIEFWLVEHLEDSIKECIKAGMFLGLELSRIRETENK